MKKINQAGYHLYRDVPQIESTRRFLAVHSLNSWLPQKSKPGTTLLLLYITQYDSGDMSSWMVRNSSSNIMTFAEIEDNSQTVTSLLRNLINRPDLTSSTENLFRFCLYNMHGIACTAHLPQARRCNLLSYFVSLFTLWRRWSEKARSKENRNRQLYGFIWLGVVLSWKNLLAIVDRFI